MSMDKRFYVVLLNVSPPFVGNKPMLWHGMTSKEAGTWCKKLRDYADNGSGYERIGKRAWIRDISSYHHRPAYVLFAVGEWTEDLNFDNYRLVRPGQYPL